MDPVQTMPTNDGLTTKIYTAKEWLTYYRNIWVRNLVARTIDVENDAKLKASDPTFMVQNDDGRPVMVKERLEHRKIIVQDALDLVASIDACLADAGNDEAFAQARWSAEALKVDPDMLPAESVEGDTCELPDGTGGVYVSHEGQLVCVPKETAAAEAVAEAAAPAEVAPAAVEEAAPEADAAV
jgi:hypothetical protein